jgi:hypothetical protein
MRGLVVLMAILSPLSCDYGGNLYFTFANTAIPMLKQG